MTINSKDELKNLVDPILTSVKRTLEKLQEMSSEDFLFKGKFGSLGTKWDNPKQDDDLGEQIQQSMTMLVTAFAVDRLLQDGWSAEINGGAATGADILFKHNNETVAACEIFAATDPGNNGKFVKDLALVTKRECKTEQRYVIFASPKLFSHRSKKYKVLSHENEVYTVEYNKCKITVIYITAKKLENWVKDYQRKNPCPIPLKKN